MGQRVLSIRGKYMNINLYIGSLTLLFYRVSNLPCWRGLHHFASIIGVAFSDASKFEDIVKVRYIIFYGFSF